MTKLRIFFLVICSIFLPVACNSSSYTSTPAVVEALTETPISMQTSRPQSTNTPTATKKPVLVETPTPTLTTIATQTSTPIKPPESSPSDSQAMGTPVPSWDGLPIMPEAIEGRSAGFSYVYSADSSLEDAEAYYTQQMNLDGWELTDRQYNEEGLFGPATALMFAQDDGIAQVILTFSAEDNYTMVMLTSTSAEEIATPTSAMVANSSSLDLSQLTLKVQDLPAGFEAVPLAEFGLSEESLRQTLEIESSFAFKISTSEYFGSIRGFTTSFLARMRDSNDPERLLTQTTILADSIASGYIGNGSEIEIETLLVPDHLGDVAVGKTFAIPLDTADLAGYAIRTEMVIFQRDIATVILIVEYVDGFTPAISITEIAQILDQRILKMIDIDQ